MEKIKHLQSRCDFCGTCVAVCPRDAIELDEAELQILENRCNLCGNCIIICPVRALEVNDEAGV
jgi:anaerobic sulfite reductase subunit C